MNAQTSQRGRQASQHGSFTIERIYEASPSRVFEAWANVEAKARWFAGPDEWVEAGREFDFRVAGREYLRGRWKNGSTSRRCSSTATTTPAAVSGAPPGCWTAWASRWDSRRQKPEQPRRLASDPQLGPAA